jgi:hypothetical protein
MLTCNFCNRRNWIKKKKKKNLEDFVNACYSKEKYVKAYNPIIYPVPDEQ